MLKNSFPYFKIPAYLKLVFAALFCLTTLCGCGAPDTSKKPIDIYSPPDTQPIDGPAPGVDINNTELGKRIRQDHLNQHYAGQAWRPTIDDVRITAYYGTYNGCSAVIIPVGGTGAITNVVVAGILFTYSGSGTSIVVWKDGTFYGLQKAYDLGLLTRENIVEIARQHHVEFWGFDDGNHEGLSARLEERLKSAYLRYCLLKDPAFDLNIADDDVWVEAYYGSYNGSAVVMMGLNGQDYPDMERVVNIDGILFHYNNENNILLWKGVTFWDLQTAYDFNRVTREDLRKIADYHNSLIF